jgi:hypothetical protein
VYVKVYLIGVFHKSKGRRYALSVTLTTVGGAHGNGNNGTAMSGNSSGNDGNNRNRHNYGKGGQQQ